jgi:hypothetical protein
MSNVLKMILTFTTNRKERYNLIQLEYYIVCNCIWSNGNSASMSSFINLLV